MLDSLQDALVRKEAELKGKYQVQLTCEAADDCVAWAFGTTYFRWNGKQRRIGRIFSQWPAAMRDAPCVRSYAHPAITRQLIPIQWANVHIPPQWLSHFVPILDSIMHNKSLANSYVSLFVVFERDARGQCRLHFVCYTKTMPRISFESRIERINSLMKSMKRHCQPKRKQWWKK